MGCTYLYEIDFIGEIIAIAVASVYALCMSETRPPYLIGDDPRQRDNGGRALPGGEESGFPGCETVPMDASQFADAAR